MDLERRDPFEAEFPGLEQFVVAVRRRVLPFQLLYRIAHAVRSNGDIIRGNESAGTPVRGVAEDELPDLLG
ncbi:MAG: hypothetical protein IPI33_00575 [Dehalococcoidia bacterium]|nr:hypothetical protein [Dehalococcoidia bacterium]